MAADKEGRPPSSIAAWRSLHARDELERRFPAVATLIDMLALQNADPATVMEAVEQAQVQLGEGRSRTREDLPADASPDVKRLHTAAEVERLSDDWRALSALRTAIEAELGAVEVLLSTAKDLLLQQSLEREPIDDYIHAIRPKLAAAGLTAATARRFGREQIAQLRGILGTDRPAKVRQRKTIILRKAEVALAWTPENPWADFLSKAKDYKFQRQPNLSGATDTTALLRCGLPPYLDLKDFGYPDLMGAFESAKGPAAQDKACWAICAKWIADHVDDGMGSRVREMRQRAWSLLFGIQYGFAYELDRYSRVLIPSPWKKGEQVMAVRLT